MQYVHLKQTGVVCLDVGIVTFFCTFPDTCHCVTPSLHAIIRYKSGCPAVRHLCWGFMLGWCTDAREKHLIRWLARSWRNGRGNSSGDTFALWFTVFLLVRLVSFAR